jgi:hypothetical protein
MIRFLRTLPYWLLKTLDECSEIGREAFGVLPVEHMSRP